MSIVQASAANPMWTAFIGILGGGALVAAADAAKSFTNGERDLPTLRVVGLGLSGLGAAGGVSGIVGDIAGAIRGGNQSNAVTYDVPDFEQPPVVPATGVDGFFRLPPITKRKPKAAGKRKPSPAPVPVPEGTVDPRIRRVPTGFTAGETIGALTGGAATAAAFARQSAESIALALEQTILNAARIAGRALFG